MRPRRMATWQFDLMQNALAAGTTIALRSTDMAFSAATGKTPDLREANLMVAEKADAVSAGLFAAALECNRLWWRASMTGMPVPASAWLHLMQAAGRPAGVTVRRNARRLTRRGR